MELPDKLWQLIEVALKDLKIVEADPRYIVHMDSYWHMPKAHGKCEVCFAGAVISNTLKANPTETVTPSWFHFGSVSRKLKSLNSVRQGHMSSALEYFYGVLPDEYWAVEVPDYTEDREGFYRVVGQIKDELKEKDL